MYVPEILREMEGGTSVKNIKHYLQEMSNNEFVKFDFGNSEVNENVHNNKTPPMYDLMRVDIPVVLISSIDDILTPKEVIIE